MNKSRILQLILQRKPPLLNFGSSFVWADFDHVINGIHLEFTANGVYVWDLVFPLFDSFGFNLLFSRRFKERGYFDANQQSPTAVASQIWEGAFESLARTSAIAQNIVEFVEYFQRREALLSNAHARFIYASAFVILGDIDLGKKHLHIAMPDLKGVDVENARRLSLAMDKGISAAQAHLIHVEERVVGQLRLSRKSA